MHTYKREQSYATTAIIPLRGVYRFCLVNLDEDRGKYGAALPQSVKQIQPVLMRVSIHLFPRAVIQFNETAAATFDFDAVATLLFDKVCSVTTRVRQQQLNKIQRAPDGRCSAKRDEFDSSRVLSVV
ncbi:hypothetical protein ANTPLA_LOCUS6430 [Anthophora plagiata]